MKAKRSVALLRRNFAEGATLSGSLLQDYDAFRADSFHQFLYPNTYFGWLSVVPRVGFRATYYSDTRDLANVVQQANPNALIPDFLIDPPTRARRCCRAATVFARS